MTSRVERCNCVKYVEFVFGKQTVLNVFPLALRRIASFWAFIIVCIVSFFRMLFTTVVAILTFLVDWRTIVGVLVVLFGLWLMQMWWAVFVKILLMLIPLFIALLNVVIMFLNLMIFIYSLFAMVWNLLVPLIGMLIYLFLDFFLSIMRLLGSFFGGGGSSARAMLGLGDALGGIMQILMKMLNIVIEIFGELITALLKVSSVLFEVLSTVIGPISTVMMNLVQIQMTVIRFIFDLAYPILSPIIEIIGSLFGGGKADNTKSGKKKKKKSSPSSGRTMLGIDERQARINSMFNPSIVAEGDGGWSQQTDYIDEQFKQERRDIDTYSGDEFVMDFTHHAMEAHRIHNKYDEAHESINEVLDWHSNPVNKRALERAYAYESYHSQGWFNPEVSPLTQDEIDEKGLQRLPFGVEHEFADETNTHRFVLGAFHAVRQTMHKANEHVRSGEFRRDFDQFAQSNNFISAEHMIDHISTRYTDPALIIHDYSPSNNEAFMHVANYIDPDSADRRFWGDYVKNDPRSGPMMPNGKRAMLLLDMSILARTDCYNSDPRNPLCLPEFPKNFQIPGVFFKMKYDLNPDKNCPMIETNCIYCWQRIFNAFMVVIIWLSAFWVAIIGIEALLLQYPAFAPVFKALIPYQLNTLPSADDYMCTIIYLYDLVAIFVFLHIFKIAAYPFCMWVIGCVKAFMAHLHRLRAWTEDDMESYSIIDPRVIKYAHDSTIFEENKPVRTRRRLFPQYTSRRSKPADVGEQIDGVRRWHRKHHSHILCGRNSHLNFMGASMAMADISDVENFNDDDEEREEEESNYLHRLDELEALLSHFRPYFGAPSKSHNYVQDVVHGRMFGMLKSLEDAHPLHVFSITFLHRLLERLEGTVPLTVPLNVFDEHIQQIVLMRHPKNSFFF